MLPVDADYRMRVDALDAAVAADLAAGRRPLAVLAVAGSTNTGSVDRLPELAALCRRHGVWLHVDAAYGGFAVITQRGRVALDGIALADSVTLDPHKWLYQPVECGALLVRKGHLLQKAFEIHPDYLQDAATPREVNLADHGLQLTRASRALKVWLSLRYFGLPAFAEAVDHCLDLAQRAQRLIEGSEALQLMAPATLGIVCFRRKPPDDDNEEDDNEGDDNEDDDEERLEQLNTRLVSELCEGGRGMVSSTRLLGRYVLRICILNHTTRWEDVEELVRWLETTTVDMGTGTRPDRSRSSLATPGWPLPSASVAADLQAMPLLADVEDTWVQWVATVGSRRRVPAGETVVRQWDVDRGFYLLLAGEAEVSVEDRALTTMRAGDFFGELAALDWGASFGYPRLATVRARTDLVLLGLSQENLAELMAAVPLVDARVRATAGVRLRRG